jgi:glyoxylate reductase
MRPKALVTRKLLPEAHAILDRYLDVRIGAVGRDLTREELILNIRDQEGLLSLLVDTVDREVMESAPRLKIIANCAVGYNNIDTAWAAERGIMVTNTPGVLTDSTADLTWALILAAARRLPQADRYTRQGRFSGWALDLFLGRDITGKCLGIVGMGRIGRAVALRAQAFRMETLYFDPHPLAPEEERSFRAAFSPFEELLARADIVTLHTSLTEASTHLIGARELARMKQTGILINVSRGPVVDEKALARALKEGEIWAAGLDVFEREPEITPELFELENVVLLPHIGSASFETRLAMASTAARNLVAGLSGETPPNLINLPKPAHS